MLELIVKAFHIWFLSYYSDLELLKWNEMDYASRKKIKTILQQYFEKNLAKNELFLNATSIELTSMN